MPLPLLTPGKPRYALYRRLGGPQVRSGQVRKILPPTGIRSPDHPGHSQSLYLLSYLAHRSLCSIGIFFSSINEMCFVIVMDYHFTVVFEKF
jgi:hypothetical protein